jgi:flavin-dependent dehydrogenase
MRLTSAFDPPPPPHSQPYANNLLVVGDAAGLCDPLTGFGIIYALLSGRAAARTIVEAIACGDLSVSTLSRQIGAIALLFGV